MKYMNNMRIMNPIEAVTPIRTPTPIVSKLVKLNNFTFDGSRFEKHVVAFANMFDELEGQKQ